MRLLFFVSLIGLIFAGMSNAQNTAVVVESSENSHYLPPAPPQAEPITEQYLQQLSGSAPVRSVGKPTMATGPGRQHQAVGPKRASGLPPAPYRAPMQANTRPSGPNPATKQGRWNAPPRRPEANDWMQRFQPAEQNIPATNPAFDVPPPPQAQTGNQEADPGDHLPPELAKRRTELRRASRQENHALLGELMSAQDAVEDLMAVERPDPKAVGEAYGRIFDIQRRMIELRVRSKNALLEIWDEAREQLKTTELPRPSEPPLAR